MNINELLSEQELDEIDRRGFLKGLGAAGAAAASSAIAAPVTRHAVTDPMSGVTQTNFQLRSEDKRAVLAWHQTKLILVLLNDKIDYATHLRNQRNEGRYKFGNGPVQNFSFTESESNTAVFSEPSKSQFLQTLKQHTGKLLIEIPTRKNGLKPIIFNID